jgi:FdhD protein
MRRQAAQADVLSNRADSRPGEGYCNFPGGPAADAAPKPPVTTAEGYLLRGGAATPLLDAVAEEIPVALAYNGVSHAVMMATPADLEDFALGFSLSEGILQHADELLDIGLADAPQGLIVKMTISAHRFAALKERRRNLTGRTGCGLCGVDSLDQAIRPLRAVRRQSAVAVEAIERALGDLAGRQLLNRVTRALHAAAWADSDGNIRIAKEDIGRHNALDKLIGALAAAKIDPASGFALITSRCSYEMVQKAATAGIPMLVAISAPTALAVRMADAANLTLVALARADGMRVYSHHEYIGCTDWQLKEELIAAE